SARGEFAVPKGEDALAKVAESGRPVRRWHELLAQYRPEALDRWNAFTKDFLALQSVSEKVKNLIIVAIDAVDAWPGIKPYCDRAFDAGARTQELIDVCLIVGWLKGPHALNFGLTNLHEVIAERKAAGKPVP